MSIIDILLHQGKQYIPDLSKPILPEIFRGLPIIDAKSCEASCTSCIDVCPTDAIILNNTVSIDLGKCVFCGECQVECPTQKIKFTLKIRFSKIIDFSLKYSIQKNSYRLTDNFPMYITESTPTLRADLQA